MIEVDLRETNQGIRARLRAMRTGEIARATVRALNKTATTVRAKVPQVIRERYSVRAGSVRRRLKIERASRARQEAAIVALDRPIVLTSFRVNWRPQWTGARIKFRKDRGPAILPGVFVRTTAKGQRLAFKRQGKPRLPLVVQTTDHLTEAELPQMFLDEAVASANVQVARVRYARVLEQEIKFELMRSAVREIKKGGGA